ncbi:hypothetical protein FRB96_006071 [Tulasnella sp. 330]|nr:hypothetical protein FRB96_006071 [Tulasnella sp. 330]KAG8875909.1 hypothetical protein FRB97_004645 [Tulasnella sp. 331]KAG8889534.1 hypothetical protein FRB98_004008 [Tulasnella sp. 332]
MRFTSITSLLTAACLTSSSLAHVSSISAPTTAVTRNQPFKVTLHTQDYSQAWWDYSAIFGFKPLAGPVLADGIGTPASSVFLRTDHWKTGNGQFTWDVRAPTTPGAFNLTAAITSVVGVEGEVIVKFYSTQVQVK